MKTGKIIGTALFAASILAGVGVAVASPAQATAQSYVTVAYEMPGWIDSTTPTWSQTVYSFHDDANLHGFDTELASLPVPCGESRQFQIDVNYDTEKIRNTIAGGVLHGPNNPGESLIEGGWGVAYKLVKVDGPVCAEKPVPRPWSEAHDEASCDVVIEYRAEGYYDLTFDNITNVWVENPEPTVTRSTSKGRDTTPEERAVLCAPVPTPEPPVVGTPNPPAAPELAETGEREENIAKGVGIGLGIMLAGVLTIVAATKRKRDK